MTAPPSHIELWLRRARTRLVVGAILTALPAWTYALWLAIEVPFAGLALGLLATLGIAFLVSVDWRRHDRVWLCRQLDAREQTLEDSSSLLLVDPATLAPLARLQRARIEARLRALPGPGPYPRWAWRRLLASSLTFAVLALAWHLHSGREAVPELAVAGAAHTVAPLQVSAQIEIEAPAYTGIAARSIDDTFDLRLPEGARVTWSLRTNTDVQALRLLFVNGTTLDLRNDNGQWRGARVFDRSTLYRIEVNGAELASDPGLHRIEVIADRAPELRLLEPEQALSLHRPGHRYWRLRWLASDDYGIADSELHLTLAFGDGDNVQFREFTHRFSGTGARTKQWQHAVDLQAIGFVAGSELIARIRVRDLRSPHANSTQHPSVILRWPPASNRTGEAMQGIVQSTLPTYFRSQRQIVIDIEQLLAEEPHLSRDVFVDRSDAIGVDQRILRLRYGQFLGEESEVGESAEGGDTEEGADATKQASGIGDDGGIVARFGHTHDSAEATTLFDPETRSLLKVAIDAMWRSEEQLRLGQPHSARPHALAALELIQQVQQATRIYLARVGLQLPPIDFGRRLGGKRDGQGARPDPLRASTPPSAEPLLALWQVLDHAVGGEMLHRAIAAALAFSETAEIEDAQRLALAAALDALVRAPDCAECRRALRAALWPLLPPTTPVPVARPRDPYDGAWLDAVSAGGNL